MKSLVFATNNENKVREIRAVLANDFQIVPLKEAGILIDIPEPHLTLEENASEKSATIFKLTGQSCFAEDTGLEVASLGGEPGVRSARYAGDDADFSRNIEKLLLKLEGQTDRKARFRTIISLIIDGTEHQFEGFCTGAITEHVSGEKGFGYDPVFIPEGANKTFAEMSMEEKNTFSHRRKAVDQLVSFLNSYHGED